MRRITGVLLILAALAVFGVRIKKSIVLKQEVTGLLKRAADANTIPLAEEELSKAIAYLESHGLTEGYTSVLWKVPSEDISFWYRNLKASQQELQQLNSVSALERTNVLMKLRETLLDTGERTKVTVPQGLAVYPHNGFWVILLWASLAACVVGVALMVPGEGSNKGQMEV